MRTSRARTPGSDLFERRMDALYARDGAGRMIATNEWDARPAPRFHLMRTTAGPVCRFGAGVPDDLAGELSAIAAREPPFDPAVREPVGRERLLAALAARAPIERVWSGPVFRAAGPIARLGPAVQLGPADATRLAGRFDDWIADLAHRSPFLAVLVDGRAAAICASVRISAAVHCAGVETHPDFRRRGLGAQAVGAWAARVQALGATPFYSTSWDNIGSQGVARRLGLALAGHDFHVT